MSLSKVSAESLALMSRWLDGVNIINLLKCGEKQLAHTLRIAKLAIQFEVNHIGFFSIPDILKSISTYFTRCHSLVFIDKERVGPISKKTWSRYLDMSKMVGLQLMVREFAYLGSGSFVDLMTTCLLQVSEHLNVLFPNVGRWTTGAIQNSCLSLGLRFAAPVCKVVSNILPKSASMISMGLGVEDQNDNTAEITRIATTFASSPLVSFYSSLIMDHNIFGLTAFQHLTELSMVCRSSLTTSTFPKSLTSFSLLVDKLDNSSAATSYVVTLVDAPPDIKIFQITGKFDLVIEEALPVHLENLAAPIVVDSLHMLSAKTLPRTLKTASIYYILLDLKQRDDRVSLGTHLFQDIDDETWIPFWPDAMRFDTSLLLWDAVSADALEAHFTGAAQISAACYYTWKHFVVFCKGNFTANHPNMNLQELVDIVLSTCKQERIALQLQFKDDNFLSSVYNLLQSIDDQGQYLRIDKTFTTHIQVTDVDSSQQVAWQQSQYVLANIYKTCPNLTSLSFCITCKSPNQCDFVIPSWVRSLAIDGMTNSKFVFDDRDNIDFLKMSMPDRRNDDSDYSSFNLPDILLQLPSRLVTLELGLLQRVGYMDYVTVDIQSFFALLPCSLLYLYIKQTPWSRMVSQSPPLETVAATSLPPNLRVLDWGRYHVTYNNLLRFCKNVATISSLRRLVITYCYLDMLDFAHKKTGHVLELATQPSILRNPIEAVRISDNKASSHSFRPTPKRYQFGSLQTILGLMVLAVACICFLYYANNKPV